MTTTPQERQEIDRLPDDLAAAVTRAGSTVAVAESVTGGSIAVRLAAAQNASQWFRGALVAYSNDVKVDLLGVAPGPVITEKCAKQMAGAVRQLLGADFAVATTGVGGPAATEGQPPGTVFVATASSAGVWARHYRFDGDPAQVVQVATTQALRDLIALLARPPEADERTDGAAESIPAR